MRIKDKITLLKRWFGIIIKSNNVAIRQNEGKIYDLEIIKGYYNDLTRKVNKNTLLDEC